MSEAHRPTPGSEPILSAAKMLARGAQPEANASDRSAAAPLAAPSLDSSADLATSDKLSAGEKGGTLSRSKNWFTPATGPGLSDLKSLMDESGGPVDFSLIIEEIAATDTRLDSRLTGLLTGDGFVFAVSAFLATGSHRGWALAATVLALVSGYALLTAQQYAAQKTPGLDAKDQLPIVYGLYRRRLGLVRFSTYCTGFALAMAIFVVVLRMG